MPQNKKKRKGGPNRHARDHAKVVALYGDDEMDERRDERSVNHEVLWESPAGGADDAGLRDGDGRRARSVGTSTGKSDSARKGRSRAAQSRHEEPSLEEWKRAYEAAVAFRDLKPWQWLEEDDIFAVVNPEDGEVGYCSVMGSAGEFSALAVYRGEEGLVSYERTRQHVVEAEEQGRSPADDPETFLNQRALMASFEGSGDVDRRDRAVFQSLGLRFRGPRSWPVLRSVEPGCPPWFLSAAECRFLTCALEQAMVVAKRMKEDEGLLDSRFIVMLTREQVGLGADGKPEWKDEWRPWPDVEGAITKTESASYPPAAVDESRVNRMMKAGKSAGVWEVDVAYAPFTVAEGPRPYFPRMMLCVNRGSGEIVAFHVAELDTDGAEFVEALLEGMTQRKQYPKRLVVCRDGVAQLLVPLAQALGADLAVADYLPSVERARRGMAEYMG